MVGGDTKIWEGLFSPSLALSPQLQKSTWGLTLLWTRSKQNVLSQTLLSAPSWTVFSWKLLKNLFDSDEDFFFFLALFILGQSDDSREP